MASQYSPWAKDGVIAIKNKYGLVGIGDWNLCNAQVEYSVLVAFIASVDVPAHWRIPLLIKIALPLRAGWRSDCAAVLQGGGTDRQAALQVGVQVRFLLVSGVGQSAFQYHLQRRIWRWPRGFSCRDRVSDESRITERTPRTVRLQDAWCGVFLRFQEDSCKLEVVRLLYKHYPPCSWNFAFPAIAFLLRFPEYQFAQSWRQPSVYRHCSRQSGKETFRQLDTPYSKRCAIIFLKNFSLSFSVCS